MLHAQTTDAAAWPGWTAATILAAVLLWFGKVYLPAKDAQIERLVARLLEEGEKNRLVQSRLIEKLDEIIKGKA